MTTPSPPSLKKASRIGRMQVGERVWEEWKKRVEDAADSSSQSSTESTESDEHCTSTEHWFSVSICRLRRVTARAPPIVRRWGADGSTVL